MSKNKLINFDQGDNDNNLKLSSRERFSSTSSDSSTEVEILHNPYTAGLNSRNNLKDDRNYKTNDEIVGNGSNERFVPVDNYYGKASSQNNFIGGNTDGRKVGFEINEEINLEQVNLNENEQDSTLNSNGSDNTYTVFEEQEKLKYEYEDGTLFFDDEYDVVNFVEFVGSNEDVVRSHKYESFQKEENLGNGFVYTSKLSNKSEEGQPQSNDGQGSDVSSGKLNYNKYLEEFNTSIDQKVEHLLQNNFETFNFTVSSSSKEKTFSMPKEEATEEEASLKPKSILKTSFDASNRDSMNNYVVNVNAVHSRKKGKPKQNVSFDLSPIANETDPGGPRIFMNSSFSKRILADNVVASDNVNPVQTASLLYESKTAFQFESNSDNITKVDPSGEQRSGKYSINFKEASEKNRTKSSQVDFVLEDHEIVDLPIGMTANKNYKKLLFDSFKDVGKERNADEKRLGNVRNKIKNRLNRIMHK